LIWRIAALPRRLLLSEFFILYLCIFSFAVLIPVIPVIATPYNVSNLFSNVWLLLAVAIGQTFVLIIAGIDLSQGAVISLTSVVGGALLATKVNPDVFAQCPIWGKLLFEDGGLLAHWGWGPWVVPLGILAMLLIGLLIGLINGVTIAYARIPPFMVTLVSSMFFGALAIYLTKSENIIDLPDAFTLFGDKDLGGLIPYPLLITVLLGVVAQLVLSWTVLGRWLYAIGTNLRAAVVSGVPTRKAIVFTYMFSGFCAAVASVMYSGRMDMGRPTLGAPLLLDIIGGAVIGGTSLAGGKGKILWTFFGVVFLSLLGNALSLLNVSFFWIEIVKGSVILVAALLDVARTRILQRSA
jgi:ribose/xylose/arabinose/galactoside ABC-type transport system permease subunit